MWFVNFFKAKLLRKSVSQQFAAQLDFIIPKLCCNRCIMANMANFMAHYEKALESRQWRGEI